LPKFRTGIGTVFKLSVFKRVTAVLLYLLISGSGVRVPEGVPKCQNRAFFNRNSGFLASKFVKTVIFLLFLGQVLGQVLYF